jgi:hypothetical protein
VWGDRDGDQTRQVDEGIPGVAIILYQDLGPEIGLVSWAQTTTDALGYYRLGGIPVGQYLLEAADAAGRLPTVRIAIDVQCTSGGTIQVDVPYQWLYLPIMQNAFVIG